MPRSLIHFEPPTTAPPVPSNLHCKHCKHPHDRHEIRHRTHPVPTLVRAEIICGNCSRICKRLDNVRVKAGDKEWATTQRLDRLRAVLRGRTQA